MQTTIPKVIHYIWLGDKEIDNISKKCIQSWKEHLPDYEIKCWNDENSINIIKSNDYAYEAYNEKKWAFVSDYLRVYILYNYGGIYMDTDVQVFKSLDTFLNDGAFSSFESLTTIPTALLGAQKGNLWIKEILNYYDNRKFVLPDGSYDLTTNVTSITDLSIELGFAPNGMEQVFSDDVHIYTKDFFCPISTIGKKYNCFTSNTYAAHLFNGSWQPKWRRTLSKIRKYFNISLH